MDCYLEDVILVSYSLWGRKNVKSVYKAHGGFGHTCYMIILEDKKYLLKINVRHKLKEDIDNEIYAHEILASQLKVPKIVYRGTLRQTREAFFVQEWLDGMDAKTCMNEMSIDERKEFFYEFGTLIGKMHQIKNCCYSEDILCNKTYHSLTDFCRIRMNNSVLAIEKSNLVSNNFIKEATNKISNKIISLDMNVTPTFVHGDLHLENVILKDNHIVGLIDFERCKFLDSYYDFVKLFLWVFEEYSEYYGDFLNGYEYTNIITDDFSERVGLYLGIEYLYFIEYFGCKYYDPNMLNVYRNKLELWTEHSG